jgi:hypothetical protein
MNVTTIDPNVWYILSESRVGWTGSLQLAGLHVDMTTFCSTSDCSQLWQFQPVPNAANTYFVRNLVTTIKNQLGTCYSATEIADTKTIPCLEPSSGDVSQQWVIVPWKDSIGSMSFTNVGNKTLLMDCHIGNPVFMNDQTSTAIPEPAQHWILSSARDINDGAYSTVFVSTSQSQQIKS